MLFVVVGQKNPDSNIEFIIRIDLKSGYCKPIYYYGFAAGAVLLMLFVHSMEMAVFSIFK